MSGSRVTSDSAADVAAPRAEAVEAAGSSRRPGRGLLVAAVLLVAVEAWLHTDHFLYRFRSVFAAGRAMDKVLHVEASRPELLIVGNSRADNAFDPRTVLAALDTRRPRSAFNLGLPGADTRVLAGVVDRLDSRAAFGDGGIRYVVLTLDEALVQSLDSLGQEVFLANVSRMWADGQWHDALRASLRLYGYTDNLRQLREPAVLLRLLRAMVGNVEPMGGGAAEHLGYRAGSGALQEDAAALRQEAGSSQPPSPANVRHLWRMLDLLDARRVQVVVVFAPLLNRDVLYRTPSRPGADAFVPIVDELNRRGTPTIALDGGPPRDPVEFANAGHLNDRGAQRYSALLGAALAGVWGRQ